MISNPVINAGIWTHWLVALSGFPNFSCFPRILNVMSLVMAVAFILLILHSVEAILIAQWSSDFQIGNLITSVLTGRYRQQSNWNQGLLSSLAEVSGFLKYGLHIKGIVLYSWSSARCIKIWIVIYCRGLKFPHRAVVLLVLESDGACTGLNGHLSKETKVLLSVWCYKARGDREHYFWRYRVSEGCVKQWCDKPSWYGCLSKNKIHLLN